MSIADKKAKLKKLQANAKNPKLKEYWDMFKKGIKKLEKDIEADAQKGVEEVEKVVGDKPKAKKKKAKAKGKKKVSKADAEKELAKKVGKTEEECEDILKQYKSLRAKNKARTKKATDTKAKAKAQGKTEPSGEKTPESVIEDATTKVEKKIEKKIEKVEKTEKPKAKATPKAKKEAEKKVEKEVKEVADESVDALEGMVKAIMDSLKKYDKATAKLSLIKLRDAIDKEIAKYGDGGMVQGYDIQASLINVGNNPSYAKGGRTSQDYSKWQTAMDKFNKAKEKGDEAEMSKQSKIINSITKNYAKGGSVEKERLLDFLKEDLGKLQKDTEEIIQYVYNTNNDKEIGGYKEHIDNIEQFFSYWENTKKKLQKGGSIAINKGVEDNSKMYELRSDRGSYVVIEHPSKREVAVSTDFYTAVILWGEYVGKGEEFEDNYAKGGIVTRARALAKKDGKDLDKVSDKEYMKYRMIAQQEVGKNYAKGGKIEVGDVMANTKTKTIGIVRDVDLLGGDVRTDADGVVDADNLEHYSKSKHKEYQIAPSTKKEIGSKFAKGGQFDYNIGGALALIGQAKGVAPKTIDGADEMIGNKFKSMQKMDDFWTTSPNERRARGYAKGGKAQGYNAKDDESIAMRNRGNKSQSRKSRRDESAGMEKRGGRRKYADVRTMDRGRRKKMEAGGGLGNIAKPYNIQEGMISVGNNVKFFKKGGRTDNWIQNLNIKKGTFTKKAKNRGMSTKAFMREVLGNPENYTLKTRRQAQLMKNMM